MEDEILGELKYNGGWSKIEKIQIWGSEINLKITVSAYENETPNSNQQAAYKRFKDELDNITKISQKKLFEYIEYIKEEVMTYSGIKEIPKDILKIVSPKEVLFLENGNFAVLCNALWDKHGVAVLCRECDIVVGPQDIVWKYE